MARTGLGFCPFAEQIEGVTTFNPSHQANVGFCDHTAGGFYATMQSAAFWNNAGVSTHFAVARDGRCCQMVNIFDTAWAQGQTIPPITWVPWAAMGQQNPNLYLISTEHEDAERVNGQTVFVPGSKWTEAQYATDLKIKKWCIDECRKQAENPMQYGIDSLAGHFMFDLVNRRECPGRFWRDEYRQRLYNDLRAAPARVWAWGNEQNGCEIRGLQQVTWIGGIDVYAIGDPEGVGLGRIAKRFGADWFWLRKRLPDENAYWSREEGD